MYISAGVVLSLLASVYAVANGTYPFDLTVISAPDGSIAAKFVSFGATLTELWVKDRDGKARDVVLGYDDDTRLLTDPYHAFAVLNPIVGRYAGRIKNGTFSIPITRNPQPDGPNVYHTSLNDLTGLSTLHGGFIGWHLQNWTIVEKTRTSVTYKHLDAADEGFPGNVTAYATHTVGNGGIFHTSVHATATEKTPIGVTQHIYWNLDAFQDGLENITNHYLEVDASRVVALDGISVPTGEFINVQNTPFDFREEHSFIERWNQTIDLCSPGCRGYDHCWVYDHPNPGKPNVQLWSEQSGIKLDIYSNQLATQVFTAQFLNLLQIPRKVVHGGPSVNYGSWAGVAIEQEGPSDAINNPEWGVDQIYGPGKDYFWSSTYKFSVLD